MLKKILLILFSFIIVMVSKPAFSQMFAVFYSDVGVGNNFIFPSGLQRDIGIESNVFINPVWATGANISYHRTGDNVRMKNYFDYQLNLKRFLSSGKEFYVAGGVGFRNSFESPSAAVGLLSFEGGFLKPINNSGFDLLFALGYSHIVGNSPEDYGILRAGLLYTF